VNRGRLKNRIDLEYQRISRVRKVRGKMEIAGLLFLGVLGYLLVTHKLFFALVLTDSMLMTLAPADLVLMESISKEISVGDIALFTAPNGMDIVHRVYSIDAVGRIRTKGDNSFEPDDWILRREDIKGKVVSIDGKPVVIKNLGWYIYPTRAYIPGSDPIYELVRDTITFVHEYGVMLVVVLVLFGILISFETKKELFYYTE
jgi:signal peptidase I